MNVLSIINLLDSIIGVVIKPIIVVASLFIAITLTIGIICRSINIPVFGLEELILMSVIWLYMLGAVLASRERTHLSADFFQAFCKNKKVVKWVHLLANVISLVMAGLFISWAYALVSWGFQKGQVSPVFGIPMYLSQGGLFIASILLTFYLIRDLLNDVKDLMTMS